MKSKVLDFNKCRYSSDSEHSAYKIPSKYQRDPSGLNTILESSISEKAGKKNVAVDKLINKLSDAFKQSLKNTLKPERSRKPRIKKINTDLNGIAELKELHQDVNFPVVMFSLIKEMKE